ncbi:MAG: alginate export family protein, partial [Planctomycetota bacterium]
MRSADHTLAVLLSAAVCAGVGAQEPPPELNRPKYQFLRFNEDWSVLKDAPAEQLTDFWDPIKYVPLTKDGDIWASFGGSTRLRLESWWDFNFGSTSDADDVFLLWRSRLHADVHVGDNLRVFVEGTSALSSSRSLPGGRRTLDVDTLDLQQAFADVKFAFDGDTSLVIRPGRQSFLFGKQRLVSPLPWANTLRAWDGVSSILRIGGWTVHGFWSQFAPVRKYEFNDPDSQTEFYGVYATGSLPAPGLGADLYFLGLDRDDAITFNGTTGSEERYTLGGRLFGAIPGTGFDYDFEGAYQFGEVGAGDVSAFMIGSQFGYKAADLWGAPRFY